MTTPSGSGPPGVLSYYYDGFLGVPSPGSTASSSGRPINLTAIDAAALEKLMDGMPRRVGISTPTSRYITLGYDYPVKGPNLSYYVSSPDGTGYAVASLDGDVRYVYKPSGPARVGMTQPARP